MSVRTFCFFLGLYELWLMRRAVLADCTELKDEAMLTVSLMIQNVLMLYWLTS